MCAGCLCEPRDWGWPGFAGTCILPGISPSLVLSFFVALQVLTTTRAQCRLSLGVELVGAISVFCDLESER